MALKDPTPVLEPQFSSDDATPTPWAQARDPEEGEGVLALECASGRTPARHADRGRLAGRRLILFHWADRTQGEEPRAEPALRDHDRLQRP
jgi:hypothetical protein